APKATRSAGGSRFPAVVLWFGRVETGLGFGGSLGSADGGEERGGGADRGGEEQGGHHGIDEGLAGGIDEGCAVGAHLTGGGEGAADAFGDGVGDLGREAGGGWFDVGLVGGVEDRSDE